VFNGYKVAVFQDEKRSEMGGNDCPMIRMYWTPLQYTFKNNSDDKFCYVIFITMKTEKEI
jgi:hypothetical protein